MEIRVTKAVAPVRIYGKPAVVVAVLIHDHGRV
jgi:hypothetical protein